MQQSQPNVEPKRTPAQRRAAGRTRPAVLSVAAFCAVLGVVGAGVWALGRGGNESGLGDPGQAPQWAVVRREPIPVLVVAEGDLIAKDQVDVLNLIDHPDEETIVNIVEEGTWVKQGDWLYTLNSPGLVLDRDDWQSRVREAESKLEEARHNLEIERDTAASAEAQARLTLELAQLSHKQWESGTHPQKVRDLNLALEKAQREMEQAQRELTFSKDLFGKDFISRTELEEDEIKLIEAENALESAKLNIEVYNNYEKVKTEKESLSKITQAQEELERTIRKNENKLQLMQATIETEKNELIQRQTRLTALQLMVDQLEIRSPSDGMVIYASTIGVGWEKYRTIRQGTGLRGGSRVMVVSNTTQMIANLYVHESRINEIEKGQRVNVRVNARPDTVFPATVIEKKNSAVQSTTGNPHLRQYQVIVQMPPKLGDDIRPGMNCSGEIYIREIPEALAVPIQAVHTEGGQHYVYVEAPGGKVRRQPIKMGGASDTLVEVLSGLEEGTRVLLRNPLPGELIIDDLKLDRLPDALPDDAFESVPVPEDEPADRSAQPQRPRPGGAEGPGGERRPGFGPGNGAGGSGSGGGEGSQRPRREAPGGPGTGGSGGGGDRPANTSPTPGA